MEIYTIRHGRTNMNDLHLWNGQYDEDINEKGIEEAKSAIETLKDIDFDVIYCSPLIRTKHTCDIINTNNVPVIYDDRLKERTLGRLDGTDLKLFGISKKDFYNYSYNMDIPDFETWPIMLNRVHSFINEIKTQKHNKVLIVSHGCVLRAIHFYFNKLPQDGDLSIFNTKNCEILKYCIDKTEEKNV